MYEFGKGVLRSNVMAHMWYNIVSATGSVEASEWRDNMVAKMTSADISKAQAMASECLSSVYQNCGD
jgi:TPR repeat protein